jgi:DNA-binding transcriptional MerR regulator
MSYYAAGFKFALEKFGGLTPSNTNVILRNIIKSPAKTPLLRNTLVGTALGAGTGALLDKEHRGRGAILGGLAGAGAGAGFSAMKEYVKAKEINKFLDTQSRLVEEEAEKMITPVREKMKTKIAPLLEKQIADLKKQIDELESRMKSTRGAELDSLYEQIERKVDEVSSKIGILDSLELYAHPFTSKRIIYKYPWVRNKILSAIAPKLNEDAAKVQRSLLIKTLGYGIPAAVVGGALTSGTPWLLSRGIRTE